MAGSPVKGRLFSQPQKWQRSVRMSAAPPPAKVEIL